MTLAEYLSKTFCFFQNDTEDGNNHFNCNRPRIFCKDGFSVSVQHSTYHYCNAYWNTEELHNYETVELGFPSEAVKQWMKYAEDSKHPKKTVYSNVPLEEVEIVLNEHGGIDYEGSIAKAYGDY